LQAYEVAFKERYGTNNPTLENEFMVIVVKTGTFALDLRADTAAEVVVTTQPGRLVAQLSVEGGYPTDETDDVWYFASDLPPLSCELGCRLDPEQPVLLEAGDTAILKQGTRCLICLWSQNEVGPLSGVLQVFVLLPDQANSGSFSWIEDWNDKNDLVSARSSGTTSRFAWAFNPGNSRCGGG
jgi:hypothetical protein